MVTRGISHVRTTICFSWMLGSGGGAYCISLMMRFRKKGVVLLWEARWLESLNTYRPASGLGLPNVLKPEGTQQQSGVGNNNRPDPFLDGGIGVVIGEDQLVRGLGDIE
ncbi:hypothetical protein QBC33DRAFT_519735 [Phialemonium atrogriseum]|uniref:Uncharacterized protein n=1 Tax=Phialemonium atrogriseum TaxID=1093897 RepID=A0AAJ0BPV7_9PEZI|nr:uncharacterized protein QBC33DRAFT_519735 [Phialemonium atrogriseum]KAK1762275.1 hypothetical protein QBC33DRAFT_519735 [Phialemonium atrogriseum]